MLLLFLQFGVSSMLAERPRLKNGVRFVMGLGSTMAQGLGRWGFGVWGLGFNSGVIYDRSKFHAFWVGWGRAGWGGVGWGR